MRSEWMASDSSITVTNLGDRGADLVHGLISPPEVALVGFGRILERPWVVDGDVTPRSIVTVTLGADHRATDGAVGSRLAILSNSLALIQISGFDRLHRRSSYRCLVGRVSVRKFTTGRLALFCRFCRASMCQASRTCFGAATSGEDNSTVSLPTMRAVAR